MKTVLFVDLDDTLFQTARKCPPDSINVGAVNKDGEAISYLSPAQQALWEKMVQSGADIIPITARSHTGLQRVRLPLQQQPFASVDFGATLLVQGAVDAAWLDQSRTVVLACEGLLQPLWEAILASVSVEPRLNAEWLTSAAGRLFISIRGGNRAPERFAQLRALCQTFVQQHPQFFLHDNHTLAVVPKAFGKEVAVAEIQRRMRLQQPILSLGLADSPTDVGFLRLCDFAGFPQSSPLWAGLSAGLA